VSAQQTRPRRYTSATVSRAREMYGDGDAWTPTQIQRYLAGQGLHDLHVETVRDWVIPGVAEDRRRRQNEATRRRRRGEKAKARTQTPALDRMRQLRAAGASCGAIAVVMNLDWGLDLTDDRVRYWLRVGREPKRATA
jgi:hypothetical protein